MRRPVGRLEVLALAAMIVTAALGLVPGSAGHVRQRPGTWYMEGATYTGSEGHRDQETDPVNIMFYNGEPSLPEGTVTLGSVTGHIHDDWSDRAVDVPTDSMTAKGCLFFNPQYMGFRARGDLEPGEQAREVVEMDDSLSSNICPATAYHTRLWDDSTHNDHTRSHKPNTWVIGNIHHDRFNATYDPRDIHDIDQPWDFAAMRLRDRLQEHCSYLKWRQLTGSGPRKFGRFQSDGMLTLILTRHVSAGPCPRRP